MSYRDFHYHEISPRQKERKEERNKRKKERKKERKKRKKERKTSEKNLSSDQFDCNNKLEPRRKKALDNSQTYTQN